MTRIHFVAIAKIISLHYDDTHRLVHKLAEYFSEDNENFNKIRFLSACNISKGSSDD